MPEKTCYICQTVFQNDDAQMQCHRCRKLPTINFHLIAKDRHGSVYTVLSGCTLRHGKSTSDTWYRDLSGGTMYDTIRKWAADAAAHGSTDIQVQFSRHTAELGWSHYNYHMRGATRPYRVARVKVIPCAFDE